MFYRISSPRRLDTLAQNDQDAHSGSKPGIQVYAFNSTLLNFCNTIALATKLHDSQGINWRLNTFKASYFAPRLSSNTSINPKEGFTHSISSSSQTPSVLTYHVIQAHVHLREGKSLSRSILPLGTVILSAHLVHYGPSCYFQVSENTNFHFNLLSVLFKIKCSRRWSLLNYFLQLFGLAITLIHVTEWQGKPMYFFKKLFVCLRRSRCCNSRTVPLAPLFGLQKEPWYIQYIVTLM